MEGGFKSIDATKQEVVDLATYIHVCEKMGEMAANGGCLLGLYDELSTFLT